MRKRVLLVASEVGLRARFACALQSAGYAVELASDEKRALKLAADSNFQVAIVAPGPSPAGLAMMQRLCDRVPGMIVLAEGPDEIAGLRRSLSRTGIDAFFLKTSSEGAVLARVGDMTAAIGGASGSIPSIVYLDDCKLDFGGLVFIDACGREVALTRCESNLLKELAGSPCQVLSREKLRRAVAGRGADPFDRSIDMLVARLRRKIEPDPKATRFLVTVPGIGYKLMVRQRSADAQSSEGEPERRQLTALACKLDGATGFAVNFDPEDLIRVTRDFQDSAIASITQMGGKIAAVTPDEILAHFGYPDAQEDAAERAVNAGLNLLAKLGQVRSPLGQPLQAQVAVATGLAIASQKQAVGEPLAVVAGLCDLAAPNSVLVAASARRLLGGAFVCGDPEPYALAGLSETVRASRVTGKRTVESRFKARCGRLTPLIGRDHELQRLSALWDQAKRGKGQVGLVCGEAGIGKSHLCETLLGHIAQEPHAIIRYQCSPQHHNSPFYPVISQLEHALGFEPMDAPEIKLKKLEATLPRVAGGSRDDVLLYAALLSIAAPAGELSSSASPKRKKDLTIEALTRHLLGLADKQPLVLVLEDAHWIDSSTLELIKRFISLIKTARILVLIKFRPEFIPPRVGELQVVTVLRLDPLGREHSRSIISNVAGGKKLTQQIEKQIIDKTDGIPLFIEELTKNVMESELAQDVDDEGAAADSLPTLSVPTTLLDSLTARLDRLGSAKEVAQIGAVIGREFSYPLLKAVLSSPPNLLKAELAQLVESELILVSGCAPNASYMFKHAIVQDAAYGMLSRRKRQQIHGRIAEILENNLPHTTKAQPELLAHHLAHAGYIERAVDYLGKAGRRAIERSANTEAIGHLTRAVQLLQSLPDSQAHRHTCLDFQVMLAQAMIANDGYAASSTRRALLHAKDFIDETTPSSQKFSVMWAIWASHYVAGEVAKQRDIAVEFLAEAERTDDTAARCVAHRALGSTYVIMGEFSLGLLHLRQARALYNPQVHASSRHQYGQDIGAAALCYLSWALWHLGHVDQALETATEAVKLAEKSTHPHTLIYTICHARGFMDLFRRRYENIPSYAALVASVSNENGFSHWRHFGRILDGWGAICDGHIEPGLDVLQKALAGWQKGGAHLWVPMFLTLEAEGHAKAGRAEAAVRVIERAIAICEDTGERWAMAEVLRTKASILLSTGRASNDEVEAFLLDSLEIARRQQARSWELRASCDLSRLWRGQGRSREALRLLQSVCDQFKEGFDADDLRNARALVRRLRREVSQESQDGSTVRIIRLGNQKLRHGNSITA